MSNSLSELDSGSNGWGARRGTDATKRLVLLPRFGSIKRALWALTKYDIIVLLWPTLNKWVCQHIEWQTVERMKTTAAKRERLDNERSTESKLSLQQERTKGDDEWRWTTMKRPYYREGEGKRGEKVRKTGDKRWWEMVVVEEGR